METITLKPKELRKEYSAFIGEAKKVDYYTKRFQKLKDSNSKISFNIWGLLFSTYWCFYRKMLGWGCIALGTEFRLYISQFCLWSDQSFRRRHRCTILILRILR